MFKATDRFIRADRLVAAESGEHLMMMDAETGGYYDLNASAALIWQALAQPCTVAELCARVQTRYEVDDETCRRSVEALLAQMLAETIVVPVTV